jgi:toxin FitB
MIVVDTNVLSELMRAHPDPHVTGWVRAQPAGSLFTTAVTVAAIRYGIERLPEGRRRDELRAVAEELFAAFTDQILSFDARAAAEYAPLAVRRDRAGHPIDGFDAQIAAICRSRRAGLATRNVKDFAGTGVDVFDPWRP